MSVRDQRVTTLPPIMTAFVFSAWRVYFIVSSAHGLASIAAGHPSAGQSLMIPVYPGNAVPDVLPQLEPAFAHYVAQWERIMVEDPSEIDKEDGHQTSEEVAATSPLWRRDTRSRETFSRCPVLRRPNQ
jgi:hypothetical protein